MSAPSISVLKADGALESFNESKLRESLRKSGASDTVALEIVDHIERELVNGMSTTDIYRHAFSLLATKQKKASARYSLRRSLLALGPTGFPFEKFIGELFKRRGFSVLLDQAVRGTCVEHEMDVVAWNREKLIMAEAKYHHELAYKSDVKVALYVKARFDDLYSAEFKYGGQSKLAEGWLITNTKFTEKAIRYGECSGMRLLGWNYPQNDNLHDTIEKAGIHPITSLTAFSEGQKRLLMEKGVVLCQQVPQAHNTMKALGFSDELITEAVEESNHLYPLTTVTTV